MQAKVNSITVEVTGPSGGASLVVRQPYGEQPRVYVAGELPEELVEDLLQNLGLRSHAPASTKVHTAPSSRRITAPLALSGAALETSTLSLEAMADLLEELASAVLRAGRRQPTSTVEELLERAWNLASGRAPLARVLSRLEEGLEPNAPKALAALALAALGELGHALRDAPSALRLELQQGKHEPLEPCTLIEVGRERERGALGFETRLLLDLNRGSLLREEGSVGERALSRGSVGRCLSVTLGRSYAGLPPPRVTIQQYEYEPAPTSEQLTSVAAFASSKLPPLSETGLELVLLPLPALLRVQSLAVDGRRRRILTGEAELPLSDGGHPGATSALLEQEREGAAVCAIAGSLGLEAMEGGSQLVVVPWSALVRQAGNLRLVSLGT